MCSSTRACSVRTALSLIIQPKPFRELVIGMGADAEDMITALTSVGNDHLATFNTEGLWLKEDVSIRCGSEEHEALRAMAIVAVLLYPIGLFLLEAGLLFTARCAILTNKHTVMSRSIAFLYQE